MFLMIVVFFVGFSFAHVDDDSPIINDLYQSTVEAQKPFTAASSSKVKNKDFQLRVNPRPADILQVAPGLIAVQHAGGGKANQYYLRGFDADHGTDVAFFLDGVPINNVSHGHGQGYTDLNFVIPELVQTMDVSKGTYDARFGNFATAGAIQLNTFKKLEETSITTTAGSFDTFRTLGIVSPNVGEWKSLMAAEIYHSNGPFKNPESLDRYNIFTKLSRDFGADSQLTLGYLAYSSGWNASGQLPNREVKANRLDRFGSIDPSEGGNSTRSTLSATWKTKLDEKQDVTFNMYQTRYDLDLFSNFTFFLNDPVNGDQIEQVDARTINGFSLAYQNRHVFGSVISTSQFGAQYRLDDIDNGLYSTRKRVRYTRVGFNPVDAHIRENNIGMYFQEDTQWSQKIRTVLGLRADQFSFKVNDRLEASGTKTSGSRDATILGPKINFIYSFTRTWDIFANYGEGFHSNDARGVVREGIDKVTPVTKSKTYETGVRKSFWENKLKLALSVFQIDLDQETVWIGDEGTTEVSGRTRRHGIEFESEYQLNSLLGVDFSMTLTKGRFRDAPSDENRIPLAPKSTLSGGITFNHDSGLSGRLGVISITDRPANETNTIVAKGYTRVDLSLRYKRKAWEYSLGLQNLLNAEINEAQFATTSQLQTESSPVEELHFSPGAPFNLLGSVKYNF